MSTRFSTRFLTSGTFSFWGRYRLHAGRMGLSPAHIIATGGASKNPHFTQIMSNVFGTVVEAASQPDSASLGAACRALQGWEADKAGTFVPFASVAPELQVHPPRCSAR